MYKVVTKRFLNEAKTICLFEIEAPLVAKHAQAGQFVIFRLDEQGERVPVSVAGWDREKGTVTVMVQAAGRTTRMLHTVEQGDYITDFVGPLGKATELEGLKKVCVVGGGVGFSGGDQVAVEKLDRVIAIGPDILMTFLADVTRPYGIKTIISLDPIMVDGTGMCGGCRVIVGGETKFACVDGPDFDAHEVDFDSLLKRAAFYKDEQDEAAKHICKMTGGKRNG